MANITASTTRWLAHWPVASALAGGLALSILILFPAGQTAAREPVTGQARVIDGDTLELAGARVRLEGIDAPEAAQSCPRRLVGTWACGKAAARRLARIVDGKTLRCDSRGTDGYGRILGVCYVDGRDVNAQMVRQGYAWAFVKYSDSYVSEEAEARAAHSGIWQAKAEPAWEYRAKRWAGAEQVAPEGCAIKGNVSANGNIYHMPWSPWYGRVRIDTGKGERWFCSEADALAAGWRPVALH
jgi:endonuclease YncB( thermonuclease family)